MCSIHGTLKVIFKLGGKLGKDGDSSRYIGGFVKVAHILYEQWGMMMIKSYVEEYGYKNWEDIYIYVQSGTTLKELLTDSDAWELFHVDELSSELELWVVIHGDSGFNRGNDTGDIGDDEYTEDDTGSDGEDDVDLEELDYDEDDLLFDANVDMTVEFHGIEDSMPHVSHALEVSTQVEQQVLGSDDESLSEGELMEKLNLPLVKKRCTKCKVVGHNKKTCPEDPQAKARQTQAKEKKKKQLRRRKGALQSVVCVEEASLNVNQSVPTLALVQNACDTDFEFWEDATKMADMYSQRDATLQEEKSTTCHPRSA
ncbi:unnamed protein product [Cuscuta campestris]|uniref:PB1-like domain-containing protein n=1 Tax=Cuscuta campestris TaxID=132261 RepID=A0A484M4P7_9ASTE|nr:unnamed protein product [Cuscuta campestris]